MKHTILTSIFLCIFIFGCADIRNALKNPFALDSPLVGKYMKKAAEYEKQGELQLALQHWEIINSLTPDKASAQKKITQIKQTISEKSNAHLMKGQILLKQNKTELSQKEFLTALRLDPNLTQALDELMGETTRDNIISYKIQKEDTFKSIATKVYHNPEMDFLINRLNRNGNSEPLTPGALLSLPYLEDIDTIRASKKRVEKEAACLKEEKIEEDLALSRDYFEAGQYEQALSITECILEENPENDEAYDLTVEAYYQLGKQYSSKNNYFASMEMFKKLDPNYKDVKKRIVELKSEMIKQSDIHYRQGLKYFINEDLKKAITEWEKALALNPSDEKIKKDIENANGLLDKLKKIK